MRTISPPTEDHAPAKRTPHRALGLLVGVCFAGVAATTVYAPQAAGGAPSILTTLATLGILAGAFLGFMPWQRFAPWRLEASCGSLAMLVAVVVYTSGGANSPFSALFFIVSACAMSARRGSAWALVVLAATLHVLPLGYDLAGVRDVVQLVSSLPVHLAVAIVASRSGMAGVSAPQTATVAPSMERDDRAPSRDPLTGLQTSAALAEYLHDVPAPGPFSILTLGVDQWAALCDRHGRASGDDIVRQVAALLRNHSRGSDIPIRYDDHTFMLIFPGTPAEIAIKLGERIRGVVEQHRFWTPQSTTRIAINVSLGVAAFPHDGTSADALARIALGRMRLVQQAHGAPIAAAS
jgi:diguanylate cyclase (GGDEF)-like protein